MKIARIVIVILKLLKIAHNENVMKHPMYFCSIGDSKLTEAEDNNYMRQILYDAKSSRTVNSSRNNQTSSN